MDWTSEVTGAMESWIEAIGSDKMHQSSVAIDPIKSELRRRQVLDTFKEDWALLTWDALQTLRRINLISACASVNLPEKYA